MRRVRGEGGGARGSGARWEPQGLAGGWPGDAHSGHFSQKTLGVEGFSFRILEEGSGGGQPVLTGPALHGSLVDWPRAGRGMPIFVDFCIILDVFQL